MATMITSGLSGLIAYQRAIDVAAQNIANANTDGYVRQRVELSTQYAPVDRYGVSVGGVKVDGIRREVNAFLIDQSRTAAAGAGRAEVMAAEADRIMSLLGSSAFGVDDTLHQLKGALEGLATDPSSLRARDTLMTELQSTIDRLKAVDGRLRDFNGEISGRIDAELIDVNTLLQQVASLNDKIFRTSITTGISPANVLDERDRLLDKLSEKLAFKIDVETNNTVTVRALDGRFLIKGVTAATLTQTDGFFDPADTRVMLQSADGVISDMTGGFSGGVLGGLVDTRTQLIAPARNEIGRIAIVLTQALNAQNALGRDLDGQAGGSLLAVGAPAVFANSANSAASSAVTLNVGVADPASSLTAADYRLTRTAGGWSVTRADSGAAVNATGSGAPGSPLAFDSVSIEITNLSQVADGDSFLVRPTTYAVGGLTSAQDDPRRIAAARGTLPFGAGDNVNALELSKIIDKAFLDGGRISMLEAADRLAGRVGSLARSAQLTFDVQKIAVDEAFRQRSDLYGVSLDEEAAALMRYQQAYQASAAVIRTANELFDELLGTVR